MLAGIHCIEGSFFLNHVISLESCQLAAVILVDVHNGLASSIKAYRIAHSCVVVEVEGGTEDGLHSENA